MVGVTDGGAASLTPGVLALVERAELLCGGERQLALFAAHPARRLPLQGDLESLAHQLRVEASAGTRVVVLASGDPLLFGIGGTLRRWLPAESLCFHPNVSAAQLAWSRIGEPWQEARTVSAHGRDLAPVLAAALLEERLAILTDAGHTPGLIARELLAAGGADRRAVVCERLGGVGERVIDTRLEALPGQSYDPLNVLLLLAPEARAASTVRPLAENVSAGRVGLAGGQDALLGDPRASVAATGRWAPGLPEDAFARSPERGGLITKRESRVLSLAALGLNDTTAVVWDIGAGTGSVAIEAALLAPHARVFAIERDAECVELIRDNIARFGTGNVTVVVGGAPAACAGLPAPDAIFVGGSGGALETIVAEALRRLPAGGRLVLNLATLEGLQAALASLRAAGCDPEVTQIAVSRGVPVGEQTRLRALNPVFIVAASGPGSGMVKA